VPRLAATLAQASTSVELRFTIRKIASLHRSKIHHLEKRPSTMW